MAMSRAVVLVRLISCTPRDQGELLIVCGGREEKPRRGRAAHFDVFRARGPRVYDGRCRWSRVTRQRGRSVRSGGASTSGSRRSTSSVQTGRAPTLPLVGGQGEKRGQEFPGNKSHHSLRLIAPRAGPSRGLRGQAPHPAKPAHFYAATWPVFTPPLTVHTGPLSVG